MLVWFVAILLLNVSKCPGQTPYRLAHVNQMEVAQFGDAEHRGPNWYDYTEGSQGAASTLEEDQASSTIELSTDEEESSSETSSGSDKETSERKRATALYRDCHPCPHDMLKKFTNIGIKWLCGAYQRARRSFKSDCMMRYRNCQDGTMFIKLHDHKCKNDSYHGRSWFYVYGL